MTIGGSVAGYVEADGDVSVRGKVGGYVHCDGDLQIGEKSSRASVGGEIECGQNCTLYGDALGDVSVDWDLILNGTVKGELNVGGNTTISGK